jgi:hypothetical protein
MEEAKRQATCRASFGKMRRDEGTIDRVGIGRSGEKEKKR